MKRRYLIAACVCICLTALGTSVFAQTYTAAEVDGNSVLLHLSSDCGRAQYTVYLLRPDGEVPTGTSGNSDAFERVEEINAQADLSGIYTAHNLTFSLADSASYGEYTMVVGGGELDGEKLKLTYGEPLEAAKAVAEINSANSGEVLAVLEKYQGKAWSLETERDIIKSQKSAVCEDVVAMIGGTAVAARDVSKAFEKACIIEEIKRCDMADLYDKLFLYEGYLDMEYPDTIKEASAGTAEIFGELRKTESIRTPDELQKALRAAEAVFKVNAADRDSVLNVIREYNDIFGIDDTDHSYLLAKGMTSQKYKTPNEVIAQYKAVRAELSKGSGESVIHRGGGSGSGGSGFQSLPVGNTVDTELVSSLDEKLAFEDLTDVEWAAPYIDYVCENNIMVGDGNGKFRPNDPINRVEFLKVLIGALKLEADDLDSVAAFSDVPQDEWYTEIVSTGVKLGIVKGINDTEFAPLQSVSRQDAAVMISRAVEAAGLELYTEKDKIGFTDAEEISDYAADAVLQLASAAVISGYEDGGFRPRGELLRCETAKMIYSVLSGLKK